MMSPAEIQQLWKEVAAQSGLEDNALKNMNGLALPAPPTSTANGQAAHLHVPNFLPNGVFPLDGFSLPGKYRQYSLEKKQSFRGMYSHIWSIGVFCMSKALHLCILIPPLRWCMCEREL